MDTYYRDFLREFWSRRTLQDYDTAKRALLNACFGTSDFYSNAFRTLGHEAEEFIANDEIGQSIWAKENGVPVTWKSRLYRNVPIVKRKKGHTWLYDIVAAQIEKQKPDIVFNQNINFFEPEFLENIKKRYGVAIVGQIASRMPSREKFRPYDLVVSSLPHYVDMFNGWGIRSYFLKLAFEPRILKKVRKTKTYMTTHVGGYGPIHTERNKLLEAIAEEVSVDFWGYGLESTSLESPIRKNYHGTAWGLDMYNILFNSKITLTKHITGVADKFANNMTLYEATGCGCLLITDTRENLPDIFKTGMEIVTYISSADLVDKIKYFTKNERERSEIAAAGQRRTLEEHNYLARARALADIFKRELS